MSKKLNEQVAIDDVMINDPLIADKIVNTERQINDRLKRIAQLKNEIATFNQQITALKDQAVSSQKASLMAAKEKEEIGPKENSQKESLIPSLENFLNEEEEGEEDDEEERFVPYFEDPYGRVYVEGNPRYQKGFDFEREEMTDKEWKKWEELSDKISEIEDEIFWINSEIQNSRNIKNDFYSNQDLIAGDIGMEGMDILSSGSSRAEKIKDLYQLGIDKNQIKSLIDEFSRMISDFENSDKEIEKLQKKKKKKISKLEKAEKKLQKLENSKFKSKEVYKKLIAGVEDYLVKDKSTIDESTEEEEITRDEEEKDEDYFFVQIPPQDEEEGDIIAKVFKEDSDSEWYVRDTIGEADWLDDLVFGEDYSKPEIIDYLGSVFGDVIEIDLEEYNEYIDDKEELDDEFYNDEDID